MICFDQDCFRFNYRIGGIAVRPSDGYILLCRDEGERSHWYLPGGRCEMDEASADALVREMREEIGKPARVGRLLFVMENFFTYGTTRFHEIGFGYLIDFPDAPEVYEHQEEFPGYEPGFSLMYRWVPPPDPENLDAPIAGYTLRPIALRRLLAQPLPENMVLIVNRENKPLGQGGITATL